MLLKLIAAIGAENAAVADRLILANFSYEGAAALLVQWRCEECPETVDLWDPGQLVGIDPGAPRCPKCWGAMTEGGMNPFTLRQRVHRMLKRVQGIVPMFEVQKRRRAVVRYGAEESGVFRNAAAAVDGGDE